MQESIQTIKDAVAEHCRLREKAELKDTLDLTGNGTLEWETSLILEVRTKVEGSEEGVNAFTQAVPVQFTVTFDAAHQHVPVYLQWGKVDTPVWQAAEPVIRERLEGQIDKQVRFFADREVVELCIIYPMHEFDFDYVYEEIVTHFGLVNSIFFEKAQEEKKG
jgi:hypothetical protein